MRISIRSIRYSVRFDRCCVRGPWWTALQNGHFRGRNDSETAASESETAASDSETAASNSETVTVVSNSEMEVSDSEMAFSDSETAVSDSKWVPKRMGTKTIV